MNYSRKMAYRFTVLDYQSSPKIRFRSLKRVKDQCRWCERKRLCSTRIGVCEQCFSDEVRGLRRRYPLDERIIVSSLRLLSLVL